MYTTYMTDGGESSSNFKACVKMNLETRSMFVCACMRTSVLICTLLMSIRMCVGTSTKGVCIVCVYP